MDWVQVVETNKHLKWPLFTSLAIDRIEKERLSIPVEAFQFWEQKDFGEMVKEVMDKSVFYKFCHEEERSQGIAYLLLEMFKIRRTINILHLHPNKAEEFFKFKWNKPFSGYRIIKKLCKLKCSSIKKMFKELPILAEVIYDRLINIMIVCQIFKPMLKMQNIKNSIGVIKQFSTCLEAQQICF